MEIGTGISDTECLKLEEKCKAIGKLLTDKIPIVSPL